MGADPLAIGNGRVGRGAEVDDEDLVRLGEAVAVHEHGEAKAIAAMQFLV